LDRLEPPGLGRLTALWLGTALAAAGVAAGITAVYLGMRDLMRESGGMCARGGPYEIANECSSGQIGLLFGGIVAVLVFMALHAAMEHWADGPRVGWPAISSVLFLALGWNFVDLGLDPPQDDGTSIGWLVSGVVFWLMAVGFLAPAAMRAAEWLRRGGAPEPAVFSQATVRAAAPRPAAQTPAAAPPTVVPTRLVVPPRGPDDPGSAR
jgi:hypothetical protein